MTIRQLVADLRLAAGTNFIRTGEGTRRGNKSIPASLCLPALNVTVRAKAEADRATL